MSGISKPYGTSKMRAEGTWKLFIWSLSAKFDFRHFSNFNSRINVTEEQENQQNSRSQKTKREKVA